MKKIIHMCLALLATAGSAGAADCSQNPDALGTSRVLALDPAEHARIGKMQYPVSLPLEDKEVVLTFDDGPLPPYTTRVLETLKAECVQATFFIVGRMAKAYPDTLRQVAAEGHTIANHTHSHALNIPHKPFEFGRDEFETGAAAIRAVLGDDTKLAPFIRFPGLGRTKALEVYMSEHNQMVWSADFPVDDWLKISSDEVYTRALQRLEQQGKGVMLLHDIQPATALMLPHLLRELKSRGYKIVHVVPAPAGSSALNVAWLSDDSAAPHAISVKHSAPATPAPRSKTPVTKPVASVPHDATDVPAYRTPWPPLSAPKASAKAQKIPVPAAKAGESGKPMFRMSPGTPPEPVGTGADAAPKHPNSFARSGTTAHSLSGHGLY